MIPRAGRAYAFLLALLLAAPQTFAAPVALPDVPIRLAPVHPDAASAAVGQTAAAVLERAHYLRRPFNTALSQEMFRLYVDGLDYNHLIFTKDDVDDLKSRFADEMLQRLLQADPSPAFTIFNRFAERLQQRVDMVKTMTGYKFDFTIDEEVSLNRRKAEWPRSEVEAADLWRKRVEYEVLQERLEKTKPEEQTKKVAQRYERFLRNISEWDAPQVLENYLQALAHALDPHTDYLGPAEKKNFDIGMRLSVFGIGAILNQEDGYVKVVTVVPGGPADKDKRLKPGDRIEAVAQGDEAFVEIVGTQLTRAVELIRGAKGTTVRLKLIPADALDPGTRVLISIVRDEVKLVDREAKAKLVELSSGTAGAKVGVISLPEFYADFASQGKGKSASKDIARLMDGLTAKGASSLVIDLRGNGGGSLAEAISMAGLFMKDGGPIVQVKDSEGGIRVLKADPRGNASTLPLAVLIGRGSASASEIFAGALQDYGRAVITGSTSTFGKGTVQELLDLSPFLPRGNPGTLKVTIQKFYRVSGASTQNKGVIPDIHLPALEDNLDVTESSLDNAMPYDEVKQAEYKRFPTLGAALPRVISASNARVAASPEFKWILEDGERLAKEMKDRTASLNEAKRRAEVDADKARQDTRTKARAGRPAPWKTEEITLQTLDGIAPPPVEPPKKSTAPAGSEDYEKAPPATDAALDETIRIVADLAGVKEKL